MGKVVFWRTLAAAYRLTFGDLRRFVHLCEPWLTAIAGVNVLAAGLALVADADFAFLFLVIASVPLVLCGFTVFAIGWQRAILTGARSDRPAGFRFERREWRFLGYALGILLIVAGAMTIATMPITILVGAVVEAAGGSAGDRITVALVNLVVMLGGLVGLGRFSLALPSLAIDDAGPVLRRAWERGRGNTFRLSFGPLLANLSITAVALPYLELVERVAGNDVTLTILLQLPLVPLSFLQLAVPLAFLSLAYRQLVGSCA